MAKLDMQWPAALVFSIACAILGGLVFTGHVHPEILLGLVMWLIPGPWKPAAFCFVLGMLTGCAPLTPAQETTAKEVAAETAYGAELQMCVEMNESEAAIDQCADTVRAKYRLDGGAQ
jgi:hypothetical protein